MVVLSASILANNGTKALLSRQFCEMSRMRVEGLLAAFPKLISGGGPGQSSASNSSPTTTQQHTFVETDTVRYVYQPLENQMYLLIITTKTSNIVEDLGTLRLLAKVIPDTAGNLSESAITTSAFELIFAFDEVLTVGGYKEEVTLSTIQKNLGMESHDEKIHNMLEEKKRDDAKVAMAARAADLDKKKMQQMKQQFMDGGMGNQGAGSSSGGMEGFGGGGYGNQGGMGGFGPGNGGMSNSGGYDYNKAQEEPKDTAPRVKVKGMSLGGVGGNKKKDNLMAAIGMEDNLSILGGGKKSSDALGLSSSAVAPAPAAPSTPLTIALEEKYTVAMNREGGIDSCDLKGTLTLTANTEAGSTVAVSVNKSTIAAQCGANWNFAPHPKVSKPDYEKKGLITLKGGKGLPLNRSVGVIRWSYAGEDAVPLSINCWPEDEGSGSINVNIEFELLRPEMNLSDVNILLPLGTTDPPSIESIDGQFKHDAQSGMLCWHHDVIDSNNTTGSLEFSIAGSDVDAFFPVQVMFKSETFMCPIEVTNVTSTSTGASIPNSLSKIATPASYTIA